MDDGTERPDTLDDLDYVLCTHRKALKALAITGRELDALAERMRDQRRHRILRRIK